MSWPVTTYCCTACNYEQGDGGTWGTREYVLGSGVRIPVRWRIGWCESCNGISAIENLSIQTRIHDYREAQQSLKLEIKQSSLSWLFGLSKSEKSLRCMYEETMEDAIDALEMLSNRKNPPHCLRCLSMQVHVPQERVSSCDDAPDSPSVFSSGRAVNADAEVKTDKYVLLHPGCGGEILPRPFDMDGMRFALRQSIQRFTPDGMFIEKEYVKGYSAPDNDYWEALSKSNRQIRDLSLSDKAESFSGMPSFLRKLAD